MKENVIIAVAMSVFFVLLTGVILFFGLNKFFTLKDFSEDELIYEENASDEISEADIENLDISVSSNGLICINGVDTGVRVEVVNGNDGKDGLTPYIAENGNWWIGDTDTGIAASGKNGLDGKNGADGRDGTDGKDGSNGIDGDDGKDGTDGFTPFINSDGFWCIGDTVTNVKAEGQNGLTPYVGENGNWFIADRDTGVCAEGKSGKDGIDGKDGVDGKDGINGKDGVDGKDGADGKNGEDGKDGLTPYIHSNGNWWIGNNDTGIPANAKNGEDGVGIYEVKIFEGSLYISYTDSPENFINLGSIKCESEEYGLEFYPLPDGTLGVSAGKLLYMESIVIPRTHNGMTVSEVLPNAFSGAMNLKSIYLPSSIRALGSGSFKGCASLEVITIPESVRYAGEGVFSGCENLTVRMIAKSIPEGFAADFNPDSRPIIFGYSENGGLTESGFSYENCDGGVAIIGYIGSSYFVRIPKEIDAKPVVCISDDAFSGNMNLSRLEIPSSVLSIGHGAFDGCKKLFEIYNFSAMELAAGSDEYGKVAKYVKIIHDSPSAESILSEDGEFLFMSNGGKDYLVSYLGVDSSVELPEKHLGNTYHVIDYAFCGNESVVSLGISSGVKSIGEYAFSDMPYLESISFGAAGCSSLTSASCAFDRCGRNTVGITVTFEAGVVTVPAYLFAGEECANIRSIIFAEGNKCETIGACAFKNLDNLVYVSLPKTLKCIEMFAFSGCISLNSVNLVGIWNCGGLMFNSLESPSANAEYLSKTYASNKFSRIS